MRREPSTVQINFSIQSEYGDLVGVIGEKGLRELRFENVDNHYDIPIEAVPYVDALDRYFKGEPLAELPLDPTGTPFQLYVWKLVREVPFGDRWSYAKLSDKLGDPNAIRAAAAANGANPIALFIPCHRIVGSDGSMVGYAWGLSRKQALLDLESGQSRLFGSF